MREDRYDHRLHEGGERETPQRAENGYFESSNGNRWRALGKNRVCVGIFPPPGEKTGLEGKPTPPKMPPAQSDRSTDRPTLQSQRKHYFVGDRFCESGAGRGMSGGELGMGFLGGDVHVLEICGLGKMRRREGGEIWDGGRVGRNWWFGTLGGVGMPKLGVWG